MRILKFIIVSVLILLPPTLAHASKRVALVIGNSQYTNAGTLTNPVNDATDVAEALRKLNFTVLLGTDTDYATMRKLLQEFSREVSDADVATLYYAGHGMSVGGENYLLPVDAELASRTDLDFQALSLSLVQRQMEQSASTRLIFLDACRNNPLTRSWTSASRSAANKGLSSPTGRTKGTYIAFATEPGNVALDGDGTRNSPFSTAFLKHITSPGLELASLMKRVRRDVTITTNDRQVPWSNSGLIGDFYFNPAEGGTATKPKSDSNELTLWKEVKDSGNEDLLKHFIATFPDSIFIQVAEVKLQQLAVLITPKDVTKTLDNLTEEAKRSIDTCHRLAADPFDQSKTGLGVNFSELTQNVSKAISACEQAVQAKQDDPTLQFQLGRALHAAGRKSEAVQWYLKAGEEKRVAQFYLGISYWQGYGVNQNYTKAVQWYRKAAERGKEPAQSLLGKAYYYGKGVVQSNSEAARWYRKAAEQGSTASQTTLGFMYEHGRGVRQSFVEAAYWYKLAVGKGNSSAQQYLGNMYEKGNGVSKDPETAADLVFAAMKQGNKTSIRYLKNTSTLSIKFKSEIQRLLKEDGVYSGPVDGSFGPGTMRAIEKYKRN